MQTYFEGLGFQLPLHVNPADAFLDIISGAILPTTARGSLRQTPAAPVDVATAWQQREGRAARNAVPAGNDTQQPLTACAVRVQQQQQHWKQPWGALTQLPRILLLAGMLAISSSMTGLRDAFNGLRDAVAEQLLDAAAAIASRRSGAVSASHCSSRNARPPGFWRQFYLVLARTVLMRTREPLLSLTENLVWAMVGMFVGLLSDRGRASSIGSYVGNAVYGIVAIGMCATVRCKLPGWPET